MAQPIADGIGITTSRRGLARAAVVAGSGLALAGVGSVARLTGPAAVSAQDAGTPEAGELGRAGMPAWFFAVVVYQDPYPGVVQQPAEPPPGSRYVAAEVVIDNAADQPLAFSPGDVTVRSADGVAYRGGSAYGAEPFIGPRNLNGGERSRGWIWFTVAAEAALVEIAYVPEAPRLRLPLPFGS
ncbi:MAG: hypothetical protein ACRDJH_01060 [Thermomicrobiales bacterium]